ncbi:hypothetical protein RAC89_29470 [Paenibacillus sp. GD4]|uniref:hypothetical protein n=1 Tax=Paenibacillus sp. GD4 TaxID=3068890 RepID=UPI0027969749|nr:hypothetical protein [Paenibacillus sp. GD4]MDQ1914512.1 hypothetical protein [Paenibacillus sp. GD4]
MTISISLMFPDRSAKITFAIGRLQAAIENLGKSRSVLEEQRPSVNHIIIHIGDKGAAEGSFGLTADRSVGAEGFEIRRSPYEGNPALYILARDESGAMYGVLEVAEQLRIHGDLESISECIVNPGFSFRAVKFNLPWSTYRRNECFELQKETVRDLAFWQAFMDMMAENRYNVLTLWCLHPFPYMIKPTNFPKATPFTDEELADWKRFWTSLFQMAHDRGIETYLVNWNIFVSESFREHYDPSAVSDETFYHHGDYYSTDQIKQYTRECVTQLIDEYPGLTGFGISVGERMNGMTPQLRQDWIEDVYYEGMKAAGRPIKFIHRAPFSVDPSITRASIENNQGLPEPVWVEVKFNWSHAYSSTKLLMTHGGSEGMEGYWEPEPQNYKITWMVRNEDFFTLRWAQPDFIRRHLSENGQDYVGGYYIGSECFIPAVDYSHAPDSPHIQWTYAFEKHWLYYMLWGRLLYDPMTSDKVFANAIANRYGKSIGYPLLEAFSSVCKMPMALASFISFSWDFTLYTEGFLSTDKSEYNSGQAFISLEDLLSSETLDPDYLSIRRYVDHITDNKSVEGYVTPLQLADTLENDARLGLGVLASIADGSPALCCEMGDIEAWAHLGLYFAAKLRAGVCFEFYVRTGEEAERQKALQWLEQPNAVKHWDDLIRVTNSHYVEQPLLHLGKTPFSWELFRPQVLEDIEFVNASLLLDKPL